MKNFLCLGGLLRLILFCFLPVAALAAEEQDASYVLRPNDAISVSVYGEPDLSVTVRILRTGESSFPLLGPVKVVGLSVSAAAALLRELYAKDYLVDPKLNLTVTEFASEFVAVFGAVKSPGQVPIPPSGVLALETVMTAVGGLAEIADANSIQLIRASGGVSTYSLDSIRGAGGRTQLAAGDRIVVGQSAFLGKSITLLGQVGRQGPVPYPLKGKLDLVGAIALAGGMSDMANPRKVTINRKGVVTIVDFKALSQRGDRPFPIEPGDTITVAERIF